MNPVRVGILTVSDRCSRDESEDLSGPAIIKSLSGADFIVGYTAIVPDDRKTISSIIRRWVDEFDCDVILTTGGTGLAARDVTPEATKKVIDREANNLASYLLMESAKITPFAALGRGIAGIRKQSLIVNLPGSPKAAKELTDILRPLLGHAVGILRDTDASHPAF
jgi:molybdenum cofactor synthesis domain-containing protein